MLHSRAEAKRWLEVEEKEFFLNYSTQIVLQRKTIVTVSEALTRYADEVSFYKKTAKKEIQRIKYFQNHLSNVDWPLMDYRTEFLKQWEEQVMK